MVFPSFWKSQFKERMYSLTLVKKQTTNNSLVWKNSFIERVGEWNSVKLGENTTKGLRVGNTVEWWCIRYE